MLAFWMKGCLLVIVDGIKQEKLNFVMFSLANYKFITSQFSNNKRSQNNEYSSNYDKQK